ncbi:MAG: aminotransferase class V-fold PLP-dependent enzyme [Planctomycetota bacterium]
MTTPTTPTAPTTPAPGPALDIDWVRRQFPGLASEWAFLENAGGSQILGSAVERMVEYTRTSYVQLGASYEASQLAGRRIAGATAAMARWIGANDPTEVIVGASSTQLINNLAAALAPTLNAGDEIIVTNADHYANIGAWRRLAERGNLVLKTWQLDRDTLQLEPDDLSRLLSDRTRLVCYTAASNLLGTLVPAAEINRRAHAAGAQVLVDAVAFAPHRPLQVAQSGADFVVFSTYKTFGPHQAILWGRRDLLLALPGINHPFIGDHELPSKLQPGGVNHEQTVALGAIPEYFAALGRQLGASADSDDDAATALAWRAIAAHEEQLTAIVLDWIASRHDVRLIGLDTPDRARRVATISFVVEGRRSSEIPPLTDARKVAIRWGHLYSTDLVEHLGLTDRDGVVRVSAVHYNSVGEMRRLVDVLDAAL